MEGSQDRRQRAKDTASRQVSDLQIRKGSRSEKKKRGRSTAELEISKTLSEGANRRRWRRLSTRKFFKIGWSVFLSLAPVPPIPLRPFPHTPWLPV